MLRLIPYMLMVVGMVFAQSGRVDTQKFKKEAVPIQEAIDDVITSSIPGYALLQETRAAYLEGYGIAFTLEVALDTPRNPFSSPRPAAAELRKVVDGRRKEVKNKLVELLKQKVGGLESVAPMETVAVVVHWMNTNPADLPDLPVQLVASIKKQDVLDFQAGKIRSAELASRVIVREF